MRTGLNHMVHMTDTQTGPPVTFDQATQVSTTEQIGVYQAYVYPDWCFGLVSHGGSLFSTITKAVVLHCQRNPQTKHLVDSISSSISFLRPAKVGAVQIHVHELKISPIFSTYRATLRQERVPGSGDFNQDCAEATITQGNLAMEQKSGGLNLPSPSLVSQSPPPTRDGWGVLDMQKSGIPFYRQKPGYLQLFPPNSNMEQQRYEHPELGPSVRENWFRGDEPWTLERMPFLIDIFGPINMNYPEGRECWNPTLSMTLELKKLPPNKAGWEWLHGRMDLRECRNSREVLDVVISDEEGDVVALARQVSVLVPIVRYQDGGKDKDKKEGPKNKL